MSKPASLPRRPEERRTALLVQRAQAGDPAAQEELFLWLYRRLRPRVRGRLHPHLRRLAETEDIVNSALGEAFGVLPRIQFRGEAALVRLLERIALRKATRQLEVLAAKKRGGGRGIVAGSAGEALAAARPAAGPTPSQAAAQWEASALLLKALEELPPDRRELVQEVYLHQRTYAEVAQERELTEDAVRMRVGRALAALVRIYGRLKREQRRSSGAQKAENAS